MPALAPVPNIGSQLERALIAYMYACYGGERQLSSFYFSNDWKVRTPPLLDIFAQKSTEKVQHSRVESYLVTMDWKWPGINQPGVENPDFNWKSINDFVGVGMAGMSQTDDDGETYRATAYQIAQAGRRLAVLGTASVLDATPTDIANNADMVDFYCDYVEFKGATRGAMSGGEVFIKELRTFEIHACNLVDDSLFPALTFAAGSLGWIFTGDAPDFWMVEKSVDGWTWALQEAVDGATLALDISGTGTQYWRVRRSDDGATGLDPESNILKVTGA
jgi:hypothetical protein